MKSDKPLRAVVYLRMSTADQENSPERQRMQIMPYLERQGWSFEYELLDAGISGVETHKREAFQKLIADAGKGKFDVVVCECIDRFGRLDSVDSGVWTERLKSAKVPLATVR